MKKIFYTLSLCLVIVSAAAMESDTTKQSTKKSVTIASDRPGQTFSSSTIQRRTVQFQFGFSNFVFKEVANSYRSETNFQQRVADVDVRIGIVKSFEVDLGFSKLSEKTTQVSNKSNPSTESYPIFPRLTFRYQLSEDVPVTLLYSKQLHIKDGDRDNVKFFDIENGHSLMIAASHTFISNTTIAGNIAAHLGKGYEYSSLTLNLSQTIGRFGMYAEIFRLPGQSQNYFSGLNSSSKDERLPKTNFDAGVFFQAGEFILIDASYGKLKNTYKNHFFSFGLTILAK